MSLAGVAPSREMTSGAIQFGVPFASFAPAASPRVVLIACKFSETPKSDSLTLPFFVERTLAAEERVSGQSGIVRNPRQDADLPLRSQ